MEATSNCGGEGRRKARREAGLAHLFVAHGLGCSVCVLGAHFIVMRQFIIYVEPTNTFAITNVFIGGVGACHRVHRRSACSDLWYTAGARRCLAVSRPVRDSHHGVGCPVTLTSRDGHGLHNVEGIFHRIGCSYRSCCLVARDKAREKREGGEEQVVGKPIVTEMMTWEKPA